MLYNSYVFILAFLPVTFAVYFGLNRAGKLETAKAFLVLSSLFFYGYWNVVYVPLILTSILVNYWIGHRLAKADQRWMSRRTMLIGGIVFNVGLLGYYKYTDFFIANLNWLFGTNIPLLHLLLPLAISFFTFQQIAYLVDIYRRETNESSFLNYLVFITFFPQLIAGPIVHHKEMMPQFGSADTKFLNYRNIAIGIFVFSIGLFKKVALADTFAQWANAGFSNTENLALIEAWVASLSYTFQLYFDFSGYADMAIGIGLMFNIRLPINFNSPYKALNIQDFWRRWHMTLSRFLRDYVYIPLGGNRKGPSRVYVNLMLTFLIGGIWHGAGWTFVFWGFLHGAALAIHRAWAQFGFKLGRFWAWLITFNFVNIAWVFFRAEHWQDAVNILRGMLGLNGVVLPTALGGVLSGLRLEKWGIQFGDYISGVQGSIATFCWIALGFALVLLCKNSMEKMESFEPNKYRLALAANSFVISLFGMYQVTEFLYFNF